MKPTVGVLTTFFDFSRSYSLTSVVESQLVSLVKNGYKTVLFVHDNFTGDVPAGVEVRKIVPRFNLVDYSSHQKVLNGFVEQVKTAYAAFNEGFKDIDVMLEHDLIFQGWFLPYCVAIHQLAEETKIKWFHWTHSVPSSPPPNLEFPHSLRYKLPKNSKLVYLNNFGLIKAAEAYGIWPKDVRIVYNPVDPRLYWNAHPLVTQLIDKYDLLNADIIQTYPLSSTRMVDGKQLPIVIEIFGALKRQGKKVRLVVANAHANDKREKQVIQEMISYAADQGLSANEIIFTSTEAKEYELGVPREVVIQLLQLSNVFIFPSVSENCPLILLEAMLAKNLLILNENVGSMRELAQEDALYFKFGSNYDTISYSDRRKYMEDVAKIIISELSVNRPLRANARLRQKFNLDTVFKQQIEPLFYENA